MKVEEAAPPAADNQIVYELSFLPNYCKATQNANEEINSTWFSGQPFHKKSLSSLASVLDLN